MRKLISTLCIICLVLLIPTIIRVQSILPLNNHALVEKKYEGWSGVLRVWVYEGWKPGIGSTSSWLNQCISTFEKKHEGVYVQPQYVDASALETLGENGVIPPDMILFPPGLLNTPAHLLPIESTYDLLEGLQHSGDYGGFTYAVPVAMGGYLWAYNTNMLASLPDTWSDADLDISAPIDDDYHQWGAALLSLCSGRYLADQEDADTRDNVPLGDVDLGLESISETPVPTSTPEPSADSLLPCQLPSDFTFSETAYTDFVNGTLAAVPVSQREVYRLQALSDQGKGPDWQLAQSGSAAFTDQILFIAIVDRQDAQAQQELSHQFIDHLLSNDCQSTLSKVSAFSVTSAASGYAAYDALCTMEIALKAPGLMAPCAFGMQWKQSVEIIVRQFTEGDRDAWALLPQLSAVLSQ